MRTIQPGTAGRKSGSRPSRRAPAPTLRAQISVCDDQPSDSATGKLAHPSTGPPGPGLSRYLTRRQQVDFLTERGYPISLSTMNKLAMRGEGPEPEGAWGNRLLYTPKKTLEWARARFGNPAALSHKHSANANSGQSRG
jgi:hypothetical protein